MKLHYGDVRENEGVDGRDQDYASVEDVELLLGNEWGLHKQILILRLLLLLLIITVDNSGGPFKTSHMGFSLINSLIMISEKPLIWLTKYLA